MKPQSVIDMNVNAGDWVGLVSWILEPLGSVYAALALIVIIGASQWVKLLAQIVWPETAKHYPAWSFVRSTIFVIIGAVAGLALWLNDHAGAEAVPVMAFAPGLSWLISLAVLDRMWPDLSHKLRTPADRRHREDRPPCD